MENIHNIAREFLAGEGLKLGNPSKKAIFLFADWLLENYDFQKSEQTTHCHKFVLDEEATSWESCECGVTRKR